MVLPSGSLGHSDGIVGVLPNKDRCAEMEPGSSK
jgi:hypothetical protein